MATFGATVTKYRRVIAYAIEVATTQPNGAHVAFSPCLPHHDLVKLAPVLSTSTYIDMLACSYRLPHDAFDPARVAEFQTAAGGGSGPAPSIKTDADRGEATQQRALRNASA
jgi:hypothetical protein